MFGIISVILITLVSFAYLIPENSTATDVVQASATGTTTSVTSASVVNSSSELTTTNAVHTTHTTKVRTMTSTSTVSTALTTTTTTTTSSAVSTTTTVTTTTAESTTVSSEIQTSTEPVVITSAETYVSETVLTATEITTEPVIILTYDEESQNGEYDEYNHIHDDYCGCDNDYSDDYDYDYEYDYDESEISSGERTYLGTFRITHYCPCASCCGEYTGLTASGTYATAGRTISASSKFDFGTKLEIDGIVYTVEDRGGFAENTIDIFCDSHDEALEKGTYYADVYIVE